MLYRFGDYELDVQLYQLRRSGEVIELEPKVFDLLVYLIQHHDRVVSKDELLDKIWPGQVVSETALTQCVMAARKAVGDDGTRQHTIKTQHGRGYRFVALIAAPAAPVASSKLQVPSQEKVASSQLSSLDEAQQNPGEEESLSRIPLRSIRATELDVPSRVARFPWPHKGLVLTGLLLFVGVIVAVQYLSRPLPGPQPLTLNPQSLPLPDKPSIIVLPFVNLSGDPAQEYFSDGVTEEITATLSRVAGLFVIARTSAFTYKGKGIKVQDISREMGVRYVLEGSVQKADGQVRILAHLIDATTGEHLWSERYGRPLKDIFAVQDEIVQQITTTLKLQLTLQEQGWIVRKTTDNPEAYDYFLRADEYFWRNTKEASAQARQWWEKAVALDPQYAGAYAYLGLTYQREWIFRWSTDPQTLEHSLELAQQAVTLDDSLPIAHGILAQYYALKQQYDQALAEGERAIALAPNSADVYQGQAHVLNWAGKPEEALRMIEQAIRLNPRYPPLYLMELGWAYRLAGRYAEAIATLNEFLRRSPNHHGGTVLLVTAYVLQWNSQQNPDAQTLERALAAAQQVVSLNNAVSEGHVLLGSVYLWQKQYERALNEMEQAVALDPHMANYAVLAEILSRVGRSEEALADVGAAARRQIAEFFASDGTNVIDPDGAGPLFEVPIEGSLPEELNFIP